ncbi:hypothetical protein B005_4141 [Nocardiopsis alba ATCC BAA-2165]|uniref:Uncharacterized protein n=1 Tax=Nocardiopsis alba (strain ATCC BAA-2165 / BE74) TaxID=1205910 RepID=J7L7U1_NOCAA|nr:hypothetical protein B005_4141 [Nocardiopsis alba ATCC BAA-2165]
MRLQHGAHRPVRNDHALGQCFTECPSISHIGNSSSLVRRGPTPSVP